MGRIGYDPHENVSSGYLWPGIFGKLFHRGLYCDLEFLDLAPPIQHLVPPFCDGWLPSSAFLSLERNVRSWSFFWSRVEYRTLFQHHFGSLSWCWRWILCCSSFHASWRVLGNLLFPVSPIGVCWRPCTYCIVLKVLSASCLINKPFIGNPQGNYWHGHDHEMVPLSHDHNFRHYLAGLWKGMMTFIGARRQPAKRECPLLSTTATSKKVATMEHPHSQVLNPQRKGNQSHGNLQVRGESTKLFIKSKNFYK